MKVTALVLPFSLLAGSCSAILVCPQNQGYKFAIGTGQYGKDPTSKQLVEIGGRFSPSLCIGHNTDYPSSLRASVLDCGLFNRPPPDTPGRRGYVR